MGCLLLIDKILESYSDGVAISAIAESNGISEEDVIELLLKYKEENKGSKTFTDDFKKLIALRDVNGVARSAIAKELKINNSTVKKSCEKFGQACKEKAVSEDVSVKVLNAVVEEIDNVYVLKECPECQNKKLNKVDDNDYYCMDCGNEFTVKGEEVHKINWEYID